MEGRKLTHIGSPTHSEQSLRCISAQSPRPEGDPVASKCHPGTLSSTGLLPCYSPSPFSLPYECCGCCVNPRGSRGGYSRQNWES